MKETGHRLPIIVDVTSAVGFYVVSDLTQYKTRVKMFTCEEKKT